MKQKLTLFVVLLASTIAGAQISPQFFGMHSSTTNPWPSSVGVEFSSWRSLSSNNDWAYINSAPGVYDWTNLDRMLATAEANGQSVLYTVYRTPGWASSCPTCTCKQGNAPGYCYPPDDLNADGTGTDQHLKDFVTALMKHEGAGKIQYLEVWNEPNVTTEFTGTMQQLVRIAQDVHDIAKAYDPNVKITSPPETGDGSFQQGELKMGWLGQYFAAGGGAYVDVIGMHGYVLNPEDIITRANAAMVQMQQYGQNGKPLFVTEGGWTSYSGQFPANQQPGFAFRHFLGMLSTPVQRFYLYEFNNPDVGNLWDIWGKGSITNNGLAYQLYYGWLMGATMTQPCGPQASGSAVWSCNFTKPPNVKAEVIWNTAMPWGQTTTVTVPGGFISYRDLYGHVYRIRNHKVPIGYDPVVLTGTL